MASKSISKVHRRQDRVLRKEHMAYMTSNKNIPIRSTRGFENVDDNRFGEKMHRNTLAALQSTRNSVAVYNASTEMFTTENNS